MGLEALPNSDQANPLPKPLNLSYLSYFTGFKMRFHRETDLASNPALLLASYENLSKSVRTTVSSSIKQNDYYLIELVRKLNEILHIRESRGYCLEPKLQHQTSV